MTKAQVLKKINEKNGNTYKVTFEKATTGKVRVMKFTTEDMAENIPGVLTVQEITKSGNRWRAFKYKNVHEIEPIATKKALPKATVKHSATPARKVGRPARA